MAFGLTLWQQTEMPDFGRDEQIKAQALALGTGN